MTLPADISRCPGHMRRMHDNDGAEIETHAPECIGCRRLEPIDHPWVSTMPPPEFDGDGRCPERR